MSKYLTDRYTVRSARSDLEIKSGDIKTLWPQLNAEKQLSYVVALEAIVSGCNKSRGKALAAELNLRSTVEEQNFEIATLRDKLARIGQTARAIANTNILDVPGNVMAAIDRTFSFSGRAATANVVPFPRESVATVQRALLENK